MNYRFITVKKHSLVSFRPAWLVPGGKPQLMFSVCFYKCIHILCFKLLVPEVLVYFCLTISTYTKWMFLCACLIQLCWLLSPVVNYSCSTLSHLPVLDGFSHTSVSVVLLYWYLSCCWFSIVYIILIQNKQNNLLTITLKTETAQVDNGCKVEQSRGGSIIVKSG